MANNFDLIKDLMTKYDGSFYLYDEKLIARQVNSLSDNFPQFEFLYSVKTNPFAPILRYAAENGFGADAAASEEVILAEKAGLPYDKIIYSCPGKTRRDIEKTIEKAIIVADSYNELLLINDIAKQKGLSIKVGLRINLDYSMDAGRGKGSSSKFGVDECTLLEHKDFFNSLSNIKMTGIHVHLKSQVLEHTKLFNYYEKIFETSLFCKEALGWNIEFINFGGGLGVPYSIKNDTPLDIEKLSDQCADLLQKFKDQLKVRLIIETGRYVICEAGQYVTRIADMKESMGTKYLIVEKGLNGFLRPSIAELLKACVPEASSYKAAEPLFTVNDAFEFLIPEGDSASTERVSIVGSLCTAADIMVKDAVLPKAKIGDIVIVTKAGSYAYSLSPILFASHPVPYQFYLKANGDICME